LSLPARFCRRTCVYPALHLFLEIHPSSFREGENGGRIEKWSGKGGRRAQAREREEHGQERKQAEKKERKKRTKKERKGLGFREREEPGQERKRAEEEERNKEMKKKTEIEEQKDRKKGGGREWGTRGSHLHWHHPLPRKILSLESPDLAHYLLVGARDVLDQLTKHVMALGLSLGIGFTKELSEMPEQSQDDENDSHRRKTHHSVNTHAHLPLSLYENERTNNASTKRPRIDNTRGRGRTHLSEQGLYGGTVVLVRP
jgi:hypothetical protein